MSRKLIGIYSTCSSPDDYRVERKIFEDDDVEILGIASPEELVKARGVLSALIIGNAKVSAEAVRDMPRCEVICRHGQGVDNIDVEGASVRGIKVYNVPGFNTEEVSDHALAFALMLARNIPFYNDTVKNDRVWKYSSYPANVRVREMTLGLLGFGRIAQRLAVKAANLFGRISAYDLWIDCAEAERLGVSVLESMDDLLGSSDVLSIHIPLTDETYHLIGAEALSGMKPTAYLVNCSRGGIVDAEALNTALDERRLAGAAVDVIEPEPAPADYILYDQKKCVVTPHVAWYSSSAFRQMREEAADSAIRALRGEMPPSCVNAQWLKERGAASR